MLNLYPYQETLIKGCRDLFRQGKKRIIAYLPTGAGKTILAAGVIKMAQEKTSRVAFLCNRVQLVEQTSRKFTELGIRHGVIQGDNTYAHWEPVIIGSVQTLDRRGMDDYDLIIIDEAHACAGTEAYHRVMAGKRVIGLTATPYQKGLGRNVASLGGPIFETIVSGVTMRELIQNGYLVDADVWAPAEPDLSGVRIVAGDYHEEQLGQALDKPSLIGDIVEHWMRHAKNKQTMVFATTINHSIHIRDQFLESGIYAVHVDYRMSYHEKTDIYSRFRNGEITVLSNAALLSEGADFPACECLILAKSTKSKVRFTQMFGRVLRTSPGKERAIILDHSGTITELGFPWDFDVTYLDDGKPKKNDATRKDKPEPKPRKCPKCDLVMPPKTRRCPGCGFEFSPPPVVETGEGDLVQVRGKISPKQRTLQEQGKSSIYSQLLQMAQDRGKGEGWVKAQYKAIFGTWPRQEAGLAPPTPELLSWIRHRNIAWAKAHRETR